jgi:Ca-activated chloride channel family protein
MFCLRVFVVSLGLTFACCLAVAQTQPAAAPAANVANAPGKTSGDDNPSGTKFITRADEVNVIFTVSDRHGKFVKDLKGSDFKVLDNNLPPKQVIYFESETDLPLRVGLLIDASNSIRDRFLFEQQAAVEFLQQIIRTKTDKAFVMAFDDDYHLEQNFTNDMDLLSKGIKGIRPGGGTALWDAVYVACRDNLMKERTEGTVRRAIIIVSDGEDNSSRVLRQEAIEMAQRAGVIVYAISTNLNNLHDPGDQNLKLLAETTGGRAFFPFKLNDLADAFNDIQGELRSQYSISYKPENLVLNGQFRPILIIPPNKQLKVRAKKGYYVARQ